MQNRWIEPLDVTFKVSWEGERIIRTVADATALLMLYSEPVRSEQFEKALVDAIFAGRVGGAKAISWFTRELRTFLRDHGIQFEEVASNAVGGSEVLDYGNGRQL